MEFKKMKVTMENGCSFVFIKRASNTRVCVYAPKGEKALSINEVTNVATPEVGSKLRFCYDDGFAADHLETSTNIVAIDIE